MKLPLRLVQVVPALGVMYAGVLASFLAARLFRNKKKTQSDKLLEGFFLLAILSAMVLGYGFWIAASAAMPLISAVLFVFAAVLEFLRELAVGLKVYLQFKNRIVLDEQDPKKYMQAEMHRKSHYKKERNAAVINGSGAFLLIGLSAVWSFLPSSALLITGMLFAIGMVHLMKKILHNWNKDTVQKKLDEQLEAIHSLFPAQTPKAERSRGKELQQSLHEKGLRTLRFFNPWLNTTVTKPGLPDLNEQSIVNRFC